MKSFIVLLALIVAVSCDVSHVVKGDGWYKDETGYHYVKPQGRSNILDEPAIEEEIIEEEVAVPEEPTKAPLADEVVEVADELPTNDYLPPVNDLKDYLPPKEEEEAKKKRQAQRQVRKVYRRFVRRH